MPIVRAFRIGWTTIAVATCLAAGSSSGIARKDLVTSLHIESMKGVPLGVLSCTRTLVCTSIGTNTPSWSSSSPTYWMATFGYETSIASRVALGVPFEPESIACFDAHECILAGGVDRGRIARTSDAGRHWVQVASPVKASRFLDATCASRQLCVVAGDTASSYSLDGGKIWRAGGTFGSGAGVWAADCVTATTCAAVSPSESLPQEIYRTTDRARSWRATVLSSSDEQLGPVSCPTQSTCVTAVQKPVPIGGGLFAMKTDWVSFSRSGRPEVRSEPVAQARFVHGFACWDPVACTLTAAGKVGPQWWYSVDGGRSWTLIVVPHEFTSLYEVGCAANGHCVVEAETRKGTWSLIFVRL